ncbi:MAG: hypothetical protein H6Q04_1285 [Acidobacteria bacterium]|nr:hypothetical protein [Acidobacteriota bacterium]
MTILAGVQGVQGELVELMPPDQKAKTQAVVDGGLQCLGKALEIRPDYFNAMEYQNLLLKEKAKFEKDEMTKAELIRQANLLAQRALTHRMKAQEPRDCLNSPGTPILLFPMVSPVLHSCPRFCRRSGCR